MAHSSSRPGFPLGAARSSFVASVRKKSADMGALLHLLDGQVVVPGDDADRIKARVKARATLIAELELLAQGAETMRIEGMGPVVQEALAVIRRAPKYEILGTEESARVETLLASFATLAYRAGEPSRVVKPTRLALLVGAPEAERVLALPLEDGNSYESVHAKGIEEAIEQARTLLPDVVLVDADCIDMTALLGQLEESVPEILPVVVMGSDAEQHQKQWQASGATRVLQKPVTPRGLRSQVDELFQGDRVRKLRGAVGTPTLGALRKLLTEELDRAMASVSGDDSTTIPLGEGSEVLGALWGAASRIREVVTARTGGTVRFSSEGPYGVIALAPSLDLEQLSGRRSPGGRQAAAFSLTGLDVVVADDDPAVVWFLADALRGAGATVHEAHDGEAALALAERIVPDLLVTDILMPKLDGLALSRRIKSHPLLAGTPILLLSWKEDLLTKVKELGAGAAGYLCKDSDRGMVVFHAREALAARVRVRARLAEGMTDQKEVHGRFDALTPYGLLRMVQKLGGPVRVVVRDAAAHYEITCEGDRVWAVKTTVTGELVRGEAALTALLGVRAGRFVVAPAKAAEKSAAGLLLDVVGAAFAERVTLVQSALEANRDVATAHFRFEPELLAEYTRTVPVTVAAALRALACGSALGEVRTSETAPWLPEALQDLASRGALLEAGVIGLVARPASAEEEGSAPLAPREVASSNEEASLAPAPFAEPELDVPSQMSAPVAPVPTPSPITWSVEEALGEDTEIDAAYAAAPEAAALQAEIHVQTAPDPTLYGGKDRVAANHLGEEPVRVAAPKLRASLLERAESKQHDSLAPSAADPEATVHVRKSAKKARRSLFPVALFGAATGGAILLATLLSPEPKGGKAAAGVAADPQRLGDTPAGILEVDAKGGTVLVDGVPRGRGQRVTVVLPQGQHQVGLEGSAATKPVEVKASEVVRVNFDK